jgi:hypothetical protein
MEKYSEVYYDKILDDYKEILPELANDFQKTIEETFTSFKATIDEAVEAVKKDNPEFKNIYFLVTSFE